MLATDVKNVFRNAWFFLNVYTALVVIIWKSALLLCFIYMRKWSTLYLFSYFFIIFGNSNFTIVQATALGKENMFSYFFIIFGNSNFRIVQATALGKENTWYFYLDFFILDTKMTWKNETTKFLTTTNSIHIQVETNNNKNLGVSERVQTLCFGDWLSTRDKRNYWRWLKKKYVWHIVNFFIQDLLHLFARSFANFDKSQSPSTAIRPYHSYHLRQIIFYNMCFTQSIWNSRYC